QPDGVSRAGEQRRTALRRPLPARVSRDLHARRSRHRVVLRLLADPAERLQREPLVRSRDRSRRARGHVDLRSGAAPPGCRARATARRRRAAVGFAVAAERGLRGAGDAARISSGRRITRLERRNLALRRDAPPVTDADADSVPPHPPTRGAHRMNRIFASAFAAAIVLTCAPVVAPTAQAQSVATGGGLTAAQRTEIDLVGQRSVDDHGAPSVDITVLRDGRVVYQRGFGLRNVEDSVPPDAWTRYPIGSNTKQFTAASILMLQDEGKLHVDDPLAKYLPDIPHARRVTLRNLLMLTVGYAAFTEIGSFDEIGARPATPAQVVGSVVSRPLG